MAYRQGHPSAGMSTDTAAFAALLNELRGPLTGVAAVALLNPASLALCFSMSFLASSLRLILDMACQ